MFSPLWAIQLELNAISWHWKSGAWRQSAYGKRVLSTNPRWLATDGKRLEERLLEGPEKLG
jgi:hypothetical protein